MAEEKKPDFITRILGGLDGYKVVLGFLGVVGTSVAWVTMPQFTPVWQNTMTASLGLMGLGALHKIMKAENGSAKK